MSDKDKIKYSRALVPKYNTLYIVIIVILVIVVLSLIGFYFFITNKKNEEELSMVTNELVAIDVPITTEEYPSLIIEDKESDRQIGQAKMLMDYNQNCSYSISYPEVGIEEIDYLIYQQAIKLKDDFINDFFSVDMENRSFTEHVDYKSYLNDANTIKLVFINTIIDDADVVVSKKEYTHFFDLASGAEIDDMHNVVERALVNSANQPLSGEEDISFTFVFSGDTIRYASEGVGIRSEKNTKSTLVAELNEGEAVEYISGDTDWDSIVYNGAICYVKAGHLSRKRFLHKDVEIEVVDRGIDPNLPMVAITYDDGPNPNSTPRILDTLEKHGVVATFFDLGQLVNTYPDIVRREEKIGCEVGNHSYSHKNFNTLSDNEIQEEITKSENAFIKALGHKTTLFRAPYGNANLKVRENVEYPLIKWNVDSLDWKSRNKNKILTQINKTKDFDGHIILLHSIYNTTADATEALIPELLEKGYQLVTVSELAFYKGNTVLKTAHEYGKF